MKKEFAIILKKSKRSFWAIILVFSFFFRSGAIILAIIFSFFSPSHDHLVWVWGCVWGSVGGCVGVHKYPPLPGGQNIPKLYRTQDSDTCFIELKISSNHKVLRKLQHAGVFCANLECCSFLRLYDFERPQIIES